MQQLVDSLLRILSLSLILANVIMMCLEGPQKFKNKKQLELTEIRMVWKSDNQGDKQETFIQTRKRGRDGQPGWRGLTARWQQADPARWQIVEGQARLQPADTTSWQLADPAVPLLCIDKPGGMAGEQGRLCNPGLQRREIKPQTSD